MKEACLDCRPKRTNGVCILRDIFGPREERQENMEDENLTISIWTNLQKRVTDARHIVFGGVPRHDQILEDSNQLWHQLKQNTTVRFTQTSTYVKMLVIMKKTR